MHTERDVSKVELSVNESDNSSFRQSQYGGRDEIPIISTEFTGGDKNPIRKHKTYHKKNDGGDKGSASSILTPMFKKKEEDGGGHTPTGNSEFSFAASMHSKHDLQEKLKLSEQSHKSTRHRQHDDQN